jgi:hypothetical protein
MPVTADCDAHVIPGTKVNPVDALVLLSGVNFWSVVKVLSALDAIKEHENVPVFAPAAYAPRTPCAPTDPAHAERAANALAYATRVAESGCAESHVLSESVGRLLRRGGA